MYPLNDDTLSASQETARILCNPKGPQCEYKRLPLVPYLNKVKPVYIPHPSCLKSVVITQKIGRYCNIAVTPQILAKSNFCRMTATITAYPAVKVLKRTSKSEH
jgi:hypothetical protein